MKRLVVATGHGTAGWFHDESHLADAFAAEGWRAEPVPWQDIVPGDVPIVIRTAWDYSQHRPAFLQWLDAIDAAGTPCINDTALLRWNMDKRYLLELETAGHRIVPTTLLDEYSEGGVRAIMDENGWRDAIAKPVIGCGAEGLVRINDAVQTFDLSGNQWAADASPTPHGACLVQPFMPEIADGEWSLMFFGGDYQFAIRKHPAHGDIRVQEEHGGTTRLAEPSPEIIRAAKGIVDHAGACIARVDGLEVDGQFHLMEVECIEPELYFRYALGMERAYVRAVLSALEGSAKR